ncbi:hypothetical protein MCJ35_21900 [Enterocloster sp. OA13]|uniref:hypothetical protein n=1 Tax=Enterocloster sp. OA13 TaxID=2914161 RepID=UPI001F053F21|nr:hypothetical protein [Enterocloster sp. OA13]
MGGMYADACGCMRMCAYVRRKYGRCGREMGTQRQMEDADGGQSRRDRWKTRTEDKAAEADGRRGWRTEPQRQMGAADGGQSRSGRWEPRTEDKAVVVDGSREG